MLFPNNTPHSEQFQEWQREGLPPDVWPWPLPAGIHLVHIELRPVPEDLTVRYNHFVQWLMLQAMWCQLYRYHQTSHEEYQFVLDYCLELERELGIGVPNALSGVGFDLSLEYFQFDADYARYPRWLQILFARYGYKKNPARPLDDPRHPRYNEWASIREHARQREIAAMPIEFTSGPLEIEGLVIEEGG